MGSIDTTTVGATAPEAQDPNEAAGVAPVQSEQTEAAPEAAEPVETTTEATEPEGQPDEEESAGDEEE
jgi:hypothetical protein